MGSGTLTKLLMGAGLGILAVSCLTSTVIFGRFANGFTPMQKLSMKVSFDGTSEVYSTSVAIAVLGCLSAAAAISAIVLTIFMEDQTIILIILGGVSALFAFGCIVAEGVYTQKVVNSYVLDDVNAYDHKSAQKYIKEAIEDLYNQGVTNLKQAYGEEDSFQKYKDIPSFNDFKFGELDDNNRLVTYSNIWKGSEIKYITLHTSNGYIMAKYQTYSVPVAGLNFLYKESYKPKRSICWPNDDQTDVTCKNFEKNEIKAEDARPVNIISWMTLDEKIVEGTYKSHIDEEKEEITVDYEVSGFPIAYKKFDYNDYKKNKDDYDEYGFEKDSKHFKVSGQDYVKAELKETIKYQTKTIVDKNSESYVFLFATKKPDSYAKYVRDCDKYSEEENEGGDDGGYSNKRESEYENDYDGYPSDYDSLSFCARNSLENLNRVYEYNFKDYNKGKVPPKIKKYLSKRYRKQFQDLWKSYRIASDLYDVAIGSLVIQILAIAVWAVGRFIGGFGGGGNDQKSPSEGEA